MAQNNRQTLCTVLAVTAPLAHFTGAGYMAVLLAAGAVLPLTVLAGDGLSRVGKGEAALEMLWVGVVLGTLLPAAGANWPGSKAEIVVPLVILALALLTGGCEKSERASATLFWVAAVPMVLLLAVLLGVTETEWLAPVPGTWSGTLITTLLLPALNGVQRESKGNGILMTGAAAVLLALIIQGGLGTNAAAKESSPLYELGRCVGNGGFEILISVVLTLGWYGFAAYGLRAAECFGERAGMKGLESRIAVSVIAGILCFSDNRIGEMALITGSLVLWILIPMLHPKNKLKKDEKRC